MAAKRNGSQKGSKKKQPGLLSITVAELEKRVGRDVKIRVSRVSLREIMHAAAESRLDRL